MSGSPQAEFDGKAFAAGLSTAPGVYRMYAADDALLYVGKAGALRKRVTSYFNNSPKSPRIQSMLSQVAPALKSLALARTYAMSGMKTLLIEVDLRKPALSRYSGVESQVGLLEYLRTDKVDADRSIETIFDPLSDMAMITAGGRSNLPTDQMINSRAFRSLLEIACKTYDVVVLDSPPVLPVVDTRYLAQYADVVVQVVRYASTTQGEVREAANLLREMMRPGVQLVGALSHEQHHSKGSGYYGGKYAGYYGEGE